MKSHFVLGMYGSLRKNKDLDLIAVVMIVILLTGFVLE